MTARSARPGVQRLFEPRSIAVVGASPSPGKIGNVLLRNLEKFPGKLFPVHPTASEVSGRKAYSSIAAIPQSVDLALFAIPAPAVPDAIRDAARAECGGVVVYSGGWGETDAAGSARQAEIATVAREHGVRLLGPNTSGFVRPSAGVFATFVADIPQTVKPGGLSIVAQSGGVNLTLCFLAENEGTGVRFGVGLGNAPDVSWDSVLDYLADDDGTAVVALAIEGVPDGRALVAAIERVVARRPVVALKLGRTDVSGFARSHTGAMTGSFRVTRAALTQAGAVVVDSLTELLDAARALGSARLAPNLSPGVAVVTGQAGPGLLLADALGARGVSVPLLSEATQAELGRLLPPLTYQKNPVDTGRPGPTFGQVLETVRRAPGIDLLAVSLLHEPDAVTPTPLLTGVRPVVLSSQGPRAAIGVLRDELNRNDVPLFASPVRSATAVAALVQDARRRARARPGSGVAGKTVSSVRPGDGGWDEDSAKRLVGELGIATPPRVVCRTHDEARAALRSLGAPVAVKILHPGVAHKTERGGVHLGVRDDGALEAALAAIDRTEGARYLVEAMAAAGPELLLGARRDPAFGPIVVLGSGGVTAEVEDDLAIRLAPLDHEEALSMLGELKNARLYRGFRGLPAVDEAALARAIEQLGQLIASRDDLADVELNPVRVTSRGLVALDALVVSA